MIKNRDNFYTLLELAKLIEMHPGSLRKHIVAGRLKADYKINDTNVFIQETIDKFIEKWVECDGWSLKQIATIYGIHRDAIYWHVRNGKLKPVGWFRGTNVYDRNDVARLAQEMGWRFRRV